MNSWIQIPVVNGEELNIKRSVSSRMINMEKIDEIYLDLSGQTGSIIAVKDDKKEILCKADSESVTKIWMELLRSLDTATVDFIGNKYHPINYAFPNARGKDVTTIVNTFLIKTDSVKTDESLKKYERLFLSSIIGYLCAEAPTEEQNFELLNEFLKAYEFCEGDPEFKNAVDLMFEEQEKKDPSKKYIAEYKEFKCLPISKQKRVLKSCVCRIECLGFQSAPVELEEDINSWDGCSNW